MYLLLYIIMPLLFRVTHYYGTQSTNHKFVYNTISAQPISIFLQFSMISYIILYYIIIMCLYGNRHLACIIQYDFSYNFARKKIVTTIDPPPATTLPRYVYYDAAVQLSAVDQTENKFPLKKKPRNIMKKKKIKTTNNLLYIIMFTVHVYIKVIASYVWSYTSI